jgi:hypothetical protein
MAAWRKEASTKVESGLDPAVIATAVRDAIVGGTFWILTHPEFGPAVVGKYSGAFEGRNPQLTPGG